MYILIKNFILSAYLIFQKYIIQNDLERFRSFAYPLQAHALSKYIPL